ncbi:MAG: Franean1_4349 family RiPP [Anaerolineae bacterium]
MTAKTLSTLIGTAVIDENFRQILLSDPWSALNGFDLTREEKEAIASIEANSIEQFALQLARWIAQTGDRVYG